MAGDRFILGPGIRALLHDLRIPIGRLLRRASLPAGLFQFQDGSVALAPDEYFRFWEALDAEAQNSNLAVAIGQALSVEMFSPAIFAALCSPNLEVAARRLATYKRLIGPLGLDVTSDRGGLTVSYRWPAGMTPPQLLITTELVFWAALARLATRCRVRPLRVTARQLPPDPDTVAEYFGVRVRKGSADSVSFAPEDATRPFLTENEAMWKFFAPELRQRLTDLEAGASAAERVRAALMETLPTGDSTMAAVTHHLATSPRTLQRQLQMEGTTFQEILGDTRERLARHYLAHTAMTPAEIAYLLGYEDTNSFYRAFRTWTGETPDMVRTANSTASTSWWPANRSPLTKFGRGA